MRESMEAIYLQKNESELSQDEWKAAGKPKMYKRFYSNETVIAWDEIAYGSIMLRVGDKTESGTDIALNGEYIALGYYYTDGVSKVYKQL